MIHVDKGNKIEFSDIKPMDSYLGGLDSLKGKAAAVIDVLKTIDINGCITGSCLLPNFDPDAWGGTPDIDVFVYSRDELVRATMLAQTALKMRPGIGDKKSEKQEAWKLKRLQESGLNNKIHLTTYKFYSSGVIINFTYKEDKIIDRWIPCCNAASVLMSFDMSIIMRAYDIKQRVMWDLRPDDVPWNVAVPNPLRKDDHMIWTVAKWIRQFDRVPKYYSRGFDTRPVAQFYLDMIDECIAAGCLFDSEESEELFASMSEEFLKVRERIQEWLDAHKED